MQPVFFDAAMPAPAARPLAAQAPSPLVDGDGLDREVRRRIGQRPGGREAGHASAQDRDAHGRSAARVQPERGDYLAAFVDNLAAVDVALDVGVAPAGPEPLVDGAFHRDGTGAAAFLREDLTAWPSSGRRKVSPTTFRAVRRGIRPSADVTLNWSDWTPEMGCSPLPSSATAVRAVVHRSMSCPSAVPHTFATSRGLSRTRSFSAMTVPFSRGVSQRVREAPDVAGDVAVPARRHQSHVQQVVDPAGVPG